MYQRRAYQTYDATTSGSAGVFRITLACNTSCKFFDSQPAGSLRRIAPN